MAASIPIMAYTIIISSKVNPWESILFSGLKNPYAPDIDMLNRVTDFRFLFILNDIPLDGDHRTVKSTAPRAMHGGLEFPRLKAGEGKSNQCVIR